LAEIQNALADEEMNENVALDLGEVTVIAQEAVRFFGTLRGQSHRPA
jgi:hypothetical protein